MDTLQIKRASRNFFPEMLATGGGGGGGEGSSQKNFPDIPKTFSGYITFFPKCEKNFPDIPKNFPDI
jgi:hypothetical protein